MFTPFADLGSDIYYHVVASEVSSDLMPKATVEALQEIAQIEHKVIVSRVQWSSPFAQLRMCGTSR